MDPSDRETAGPIERHPGRRAREGLDIVNLLTVPEEADGQRLDRFTADQAREFPSRKAAYKAAKNERILLNGQPAPPHTRVRNGDTIAVRAPTALHAPLALPLEIHMQDESIAVITKPPGIPTSGNYARTVARALPANLTPSPRADALPAPHPVHRLDSPTGGLLLIAKTATAAMELGRQFEQRLVRKRYRAIVAGRMHPPEGALTTPVGNREAHTDYRVVAVTPSLSVGDLSLVDLFPKTGRTHQLRSQLADAGYPIIGDKTYHANRKVLRGKGLFLWAAGLTFIHPQTKQKIHCNTPEPPKFNAYIEREMRRAREKCET